MYRAHHYLSGYPSRALIIALSMWAWNSCGRAAFKDNLQASFLAVCCSTMSCNSGYKSVASRASFVQKSCLNTGVAQVRKDSSQVRTWITVFSQATSGSLGAVEVTAADSRDFFMGSGWWHILTSVCLCIIDISIPTWHWKSLNVGFSWSAFPHRLAAIAALYVYMRTWIALSSFSTETPSLRNKGTTHML